jgi:hypothetical protein
MTGMLARRCGVVICNEARHTLTDMGVVQSYGSPLFSGIVKEDIISFGRGWQPWRF